MYANLVLVVDADPVVRAVIRRALSPHTDIIEADNGLAAIALAHRHRPDLILLNHGLPDIDARTVATLIRRELTLQTIPIWSIAGSSAPAVLRAALQQGCAHLLPKPFTIYPIDDGDSAGVSR